MPVVFYIDPEIDDNSNTKEIPEITLSYTFFAVEN
jgi:cytochrome c oxidase assembly protein subunit 11